MNDIELLNYALENGIIDATNIRLKVEQMERKEYLAMHKQKVWQGKDGGWFTYLFIGSKRKLVRKSKLEVLEDAIVEHYQKGKDSPTVVFIFYKWINEKMEYNEICKGTYDRYVNDFYRFFDESFQNKLVPYITEKELEKFIKKSICDKKLSAKAYSGLRTLIIGMFKYAKSEGYTTISISTFFGDIPIGKKSFKKVFKDFAGQVFMEEEAKLIIDYAYDNPSVPNLAIALAFQTGIREGELAALMYSDWDCNKLKIQRQEIAYKDENRKRKRIHEIVNYTKTDAGFRMIYLPDSAKKTIEMLYDINGEQDYMMMYKGKTIYAENFNNYLRNICDAVGVPRRSMHKIRKTYGTTLLDAEVDESLVMSQMGHSDIETTRKYYYFSNKNDSKKAMQIQNAVYF